MSIKLNFCAVFLWINISNNYICQNQKNVLMADVHSPGIRSYNMSRIRNKDTKPELLVRMFLFSKGLRYRIHVKDLPGKPDIVFPGRKTVIFIHGCFWHGHENCKYFVVPGTRTEWWLNKIRLNKQRDAENFLKLKKAGWRILSIFECNLRKDQLSETLNRILYELH